MDAVHYPARERFGPAFQPAFPWAWTGYDDPCQANRDRGLRLFPEDPSHTTRHAGPHRAVPKVE